MVYVICSVCSTLMFSLDNNYSIARKETPDLFPEEKPFEMKEQKNDCSVLQTAHCNHINHNNLKNVKFTTLSDLLKTPTKVQATEEDLYENNGGTTLTITVENKLIIASDTRHSSEYTINSRKMTRVYRIGDYFLTTVGFYADGFELYSKLLFEVKHYETHDKISIEALAHLLHNILYTRRFFPYYSYACLSGFSDKKAKIYSYDSIGSYQETKCRCDGSGSKMIQPLLDSWVMGKNFNGFEGLNFKGALELVKKAFDGAAERDVKTKDYLEIYVVDENNVIEHEFIELRKD